MVLTEVLPGDHFQHNTTALIRVSPLLSPVMHPVRVRLHHWYVPNRIMWDGFEDFITGGSTGFDMTVPPTIDLADVQAGSLADYMGIPLGSSLNVSALPFRAYSLIFNEWYRDQDLVSPLALSTADGLDTTTNTSVANVAWEKDYFTSSRPWTQKGPEVTLPLTGDAPIEGLGIRSPYNFSRNVNVHQTGGLDGSMGNSVLGQEIEVKEDPDNIGFPLITADLSGVTAASINDLRLAFALQRYEEARARYGSRYTEYLAHLGVKSSDARLQRPEFLGGGKQTIQFSEIMQTANTTDGDDSEGVGNLKGHGIGAMKSNRYRRRFEEHGYVVSFMSVIPKTIYTQGLDRHWSRTTKEDYWQKELEHIGQQEIKNKELYGQHADPNGVFGYQDRYDEYRSQPSTVSGDFRTSKLDHWHYGRSFGSEPALNSDFITSTPTKRVNAVQTEDVLWCMINHKITARRKLSKSGLPFIK